MIDQKLAHTILQEIDTLLRKEVLPVSNNHLEHLGGGDNILECLITMKTQRLISGDLITIAASGTPHRMTNIRLTYEGIRVLRDNSRN
jgi:hypothetical protein